MGTIDLSAFLPVDHTTSDAVAIKNAFTTIQTLVNGNIDNSNIASGAAIVASKLSGYPSDPTLFLSGAGTWLVPPGGGGSSNLPTGALVSYSAAAAPSGFLLADGSAVSTTTYATLFGVVGTTWNTGGEGVGNFRLPDLRGRIPVGKGTNAAVSSLAENDGQAVGNRRPHHRTTNALTVTGTPGIGTLAVTGVSSNPLILGAGTSGLTSTTISVQVTGTAIGLSGSPDKGSLAVGGSLGSNNANDYADAPSFLVVQWLIKT